MGKGLLKGAFLGAIVLFIWMMISWMALPWHNATMNKFTNEEVIAAAVLDGAPKNGVYVYPSAKGNVKMEEKAANMKKGPVIYASIQRGGFDVKSPSPYIASFVIQLVGAFFVTFILLHTAPVSYWNRVWLSTCFGIAAGVLCAFPQWNWWGASLGFVFVELLDFTIGWFLAGLAIAAVTVNKK